MVKYIGKVLRLLPSKRVHYKRQLYCKRKNALTGERRIYVVLLLVHCFEVLENCTNVLLPVWLHSLDTCKWEMTPTPAVTSSPRVIERQIQKVFFQSAINFFGLKSRFWFKHLDIMGAAWMLQHWQSKQSFILVLDIDWNKSCFSSEKYSREKRGFSRKYRLIPVLQLNQMRLKTAVTRF